MDGFLILREKWLLLFHHLYPKKDGLILYDDTASLSNPYDALNISEDLSLATRIPAVFNVKILRNRFGPHKNAATFCEKLEANAWAYLKEPHWFRTVWERYFDAVFQVLDTDGDGMISLVEFTCYYTNRGKNAKQAEELFKLLDANKDGKISRMDYVDAYCRYMCDPDVGASELLLYDPKFGLTSKLT